MSLPVIISAAPVRQLPKRAQSRCRTSALAWDTPVSMDAERVLFGPIQPLPPIHDETRHFKLKAL